MICAIILSSFCYCVSEVQHAELQMKASKLYYENTSVTHWMVNERLLDMLDFACLGVCVSYGDRMRTAADARLCLC